MKKLPIIISIIALVAAIFLLIERFSGSSSSSDSTNTATAGSIENINVACVKLDTLLDNYNYYNDAKTVLLKKQRMKELELDSRIKALQRKAYELQRKVQDRLMTPTTAQKKQQELGLEEQRIMQDKQIYELEIMEGNQKMSLEMLDSIKNYLSIYNKKYNYNIIIATDTIGSSLLYFDKKMDITSDIVKGLNNRYISKIVDDEFEKEKEEK